jgi:hypothetical protein
MANPLEKHFLLIHNNLGEVNTKLMKFIEDELVPDDNKDPQKYLYWIRLWGGRFYFMATFENTTWTPNKIIAKIRKGVPDAHSVFCVEVQGRDCQGMMSTDFWEFVQTSQDLTKYMKGKRRAVKLKHIKQLLDKKEELKRKEEELKNREVEILKKREILNEEEELLKKEEQIKKMEQELLKKETEIKKRKKFLGIF